MLQVIPLVQLVREMNLDLYMQKKDDAGFEALLQAVITVFGKHADEELIVECIRTLNHCAQHKQQLLQVLYWPSSDGLVRGRLTFLSPPLGLVIHAP